MSIVKTVVRVMERIAPLRFAEKWDNVGLLIEAPVTSRNHKGILLTIDLTPAVLDEALSSKTSVIISYHPPIFRPLTSLTLSNPLQSSILKCIAAGISIYSPHTALDTVKGGINDWLVEGLEGLGAADVRVIEPKFEENNEHVGAGRILNYRKPVPLKDIVTSMKVYLGLKYTQLASISQAKDDVQAIRSIAVCAGSGGSMLGGVEADLYFTGEMSHHEVLAAVAKSTNVILCGHDNTERGYLPRLRYKLEQLLSGEEGGPFEIVVSSRDRHPLDMM